MDCRQVRVKHKIGVSGQVALEDGLRVLFILDQLFIQEPGSTDFRRRIIRLEERRPGHAGQCQGVLRERSGDKRQNGQEKEGENCA